MARRRIQLLRRRLKGLERQRATRRRERQRTETPTVALAGYTNVGKSTLLNALTDADVLVRDRLFETLDPTTRAFEHDGRRYLVTDTVGFIRRLPHQLVEGFAATLEETLVADLVLHVADASVSDAVAGRADGGRRGGAEGDRRRRAPARAGAEQDRRRRSAEAPAAGKPLPRRAAGVGGDRRGAGRAPRADRQRFADRFERVRLLVPYDEGATLAELYALGAPIEEREDRADGVLIDARLPRRELRRFAPFLVVEPPRATRVGPVIELPSGGSIRTASFRRAPMPATPASTSPPRSTTSLEPGERAVVATGLAVAIPEGHAGLVQPRSGLAARHGITIVNAPGLVDSGYRGELKVVLLNTDRSETFVVEPGMRIAQLVVIAVPELEPVEVDELPETERGARGFGSSGR